MRNEVIGKQIVTEEKEVVIKSTVTCNKCGETIEPYYADDMQTIHLSFGYESRFDGEKWSFDLCDNCLLDVVKTFKHVPTGFLDDSLYSVINDQEEHQKVFDHWKNTGEWEDMRFKTYEEIVELNNGWFNIESLNDAIKKFHPGKPLLVVNE